MLKDVKEKYSHIIIILLVMYGSSASFEESIVNENTVIEDTMIVMEEVEGETTFSVSGQDSMETDSLPPIEKMPELIRFVKAEYPAEIVKKGIQGVVSLGLLITDSGVVDSVFLLSALHPSLDSSAKIAAAKFTFTPAIAGGEPVPVYIQYDYRFELTEIVEKLEKYVNLSGRLVERGTRKPLSDVMVVLHFTDSLSDTALPVPFNIYIKKIGTFENQYLEEDRLVTLTDSLGNFSFYSLPACSLSLSVPSPGYKPLKEAVVISPGEETVLTLYLERFSYSDYEIVVYGKAEKTEISKRQLSISEIKKIPGFGGDAVKVVQALPGVARPVFASGALVVRGSRTWDSRFYLDGVAIPDLYHFGGIKSTYNSDALQSVDFYPGGFNTRFGGVTAGVIEIKGRKGDNKRWKGTANADVFDASFIAEGPLGKKGSLVVSARRSYIGDIIGWAINNLDFISLPVSVSPFYWDYVSRADFDLTKNQSAFFTLFGSKDRLEVVVGRIRGGSKEVDDITDRVDIMSTFHMGLWGWDWILNKKLQNEFRLALTGGRGSNSIFGIAKWQYDYQQGFLRDQITYTPMDKLLFNTGVEIDLLHWIQNTKFPTADNAFLVDKLDDVFGIVGAYATMEWKLWQNLTLIPGIRFDYFPELRYDGSIIPQFWDYSKSDLKKLERGISGEPSLRFTSRYALTKDHVIKAAVGNYSQTPQPTGTVINETLGNPYLPATKARHLVAGYEWQITDLIFSDIQLYHNYQWDIPRFTDENDLVNNIESRFIADGQSRSYGLELLLRHDQGNRFFGWIAYTLSRSMRKQPGKDWELFDRDQTNNLQFVGNIRLNAGWEIGSRIRFVSGNPDTPIIGSYYDAYNRTYMPIFGKPNSIRNDPFFQFDFRVDKKFVYNKWLFSTYIDFTNLSYFLYKSPEFEINNYNFSQTTPISSPFVPSLGIMAEF